MIFSPEALCNEWNIKAPIFYSILLSSALSVRRKDFNTVTWLPTLVPEVYFSSPLRNENNKNKPLEPGYWLPSIAMAGSVLLRERSRGMDAMQLLVTTIIRSSSSQVQYC
jgi:hypothetical protein